MPKSLVCLQLLLSMSGCAYSLVGREAASAQFDAKEFPEAALEIESIVNSSQHNEFTDATLRCIRYDERFKRARRGYLEAPDNDFGRLKGGMKAVQESIGSCADTCRLVKEAPETLERDRKIATARYQSCGAANEDHGTELIVAEKNLSDAEKALGVGNILWGNMKLETADWALSGWTSGKRSDTGQRQVLRARATEIRSQHAARLSKVRSYLEDPEVGLIALRLRQRGEGNPTLPEWAGERVAQAGARCAKAADNDCRRVQAAMARIESLRSLGGHEREALYARLKELDQQYDVH